MKSESFKVSLMILMKQCSIILIPHCNPQFDEKKGRCDPWSHQVMLALIFALKVFLIVLLRMHKQKISEIHKYMFIDVQRFSITQNTKSMKWTRQWKMLLHSCLSVRFAIRTQSETNYLRIRLRRGGDISLKKTWDWLFECRDNIDEAWIKRTYWESDEGQVIYLVKCL